MDKFWRNIVGDDVLGVPLEFKANSSSEDYKKEPFSRFLLSFM